MATTPNTQDQNDRRLGGSRWFRLLTALFAIALIATACGSSDTVSDATASDTADAVEDAVDGDDEEAMEDSGESFVVADEEEAMEDDEEEAMEDDEEAMEDSDDGRAFSGDADEEAAASAPATAAADDAASVVEETTDGGGLFGTVDVDADDVEPEPQQSADPRFTDYGIRQFIATSRDPQSTFALDVDTGSFTIGRRFLDEGSLPPRESVRVEEYVNALNYEYDAPRDGLDVVVDGGPSPFNPDNFLVRVGVQAEEIDADERQPVALTFVVDTSGSMDRPDRLGLVRESLAILVEELDRDDTVAIVTYSGQSGIVLEPTEVRERDRILDAIDSMRAGGNTNLQAGLDAGYNLAREAFRDDGVNRVIVASDGLANAGITDVDALAARLRRDADAGISVVTLGYGLNGFNDTTMEQLADQGDGFFSYIDTIDEAERLFSDELTSTLITSAIDAKIQVEFDESVVDEYRLIGYENRGVRDSDFRNDDIDAGELGAGHQATAIYEIVLDRDVDIDDRAEIGIVALRWEDPDTGEVLEIDEDIDLRDIEPRWTDTPVDFRQATVVATFAEILRDNPFADEVDLIDLADEVNALSRDVDTDEFDSFADMVDQAARLS